MPPRLSLLSTLRTYLLARNRVTVKAPSDAASSANEVSVVLEVNSANSVNEVSTVSVTIVVNAAANYVSFP